MIFKCPLCAKSYWTKSGREKCLRNHRYLRFRAQTSNSFGREPDKAPIPYDPPSSSNSSDTLNTLSNMAFGYMMGDMIGDLSQGSKKEEPAEAPAPQVESSWSQPAEDTSYRSAPTVSEDTSSSLGSYSSLDGYSSLDSSSSNDW